MVAAGQGHAPRFPLHFPAGNFVCDRKEGLGTLYMLSRQRKLVAEYVGGTPRCGTVLELDDEDISDSEAGPGGNRCGSWLCNGHLRLDLHLIQEMVPC